MRGKQKVLKRNHQMAKNRKLTKKEMLDLLTGYYREENYQFTDLSITAERNGQKYCLKHDRHGTLKWMIT